MGYYIQVPERFNKALQIVDLYGGELVTGSPQMPKSFSDIPPDKALIVILRNQHFEAAGFCYNEDEFREFTDPSDMRHKEYVLMDLETARQLTGYSK